MYEELTRFLPELQRESFGNLIVDRENDGSPEHPIQFPYIDYDRVVVDLIHTVYRFSDQHKEMELNRYSDLLKKNGIEWAYDSMKSADVSSLDGQTVMALILGAIRADRFSEGTLLNFCEDGSITKWITRLAVIDEKQLESS